MVESTCVSRLLCLPSVKFACLVIMYFTRFSRFSERSSTFTKKCCLHLLKLKLWDKKKKHPCKTKTNYSYFELCDDSGVVDRFMFFVLFFCCCCCFCHVLQELAFSGARFVEQVEELRRKEERKKKGLLL